MGIIRASHTKMYLTGLAMAIAVGKYASTFCMYLSVLFSVNVDVTSSTVRQSSFGVSFFRSLMKQRPQIYLYIYTFTYMIYVWHRTGTHAIVVTSFFFWHWFCLWQLCACKQCPHDIYLRMYYYCYCCSDCPFAIYLYIFIFIFIANEHWVLMLQMDVCKICVSYCVPQTRISMYSRMSVLIWCSNPVLIWTKPVKFPTAQISSLKNWIISNSIYWHNCPIRKWNSKQ